MDKKEFIFPGVILGVVIIIAVALLIGHSEKPKLIPDGMVATSTEPAASTTPAPHAASPAAGTPSAYYPYGAITLSLNQAAGFKDGTAIRPTAVLEDSRCPMGVMCIQAGTVRVSLKTNVAGKEGVQTIKISESISVGTDTVTLVSVDPVRMKEGAPESSAYRFHFTVTHAAPSVSAKPCYVGGCSAQLCTDSPNAISNCMYSSQYACYKTATCERQTTGQCGWTETAELKACLANPSTL